MVVQRKVSRPRGAARVNHARVTSKGQVTIPKPVRDRLGLKAGDEVAFVEDEDGAHVRRYVPESPFAAWRGYLKDLKGKDVDRLID